MSNVGALVDVLVGAASGGMLGSVFTRLSIKRPPKPEPEPQPICLCDHPISFHAEMASRCTYVEYKKLKTETAALDGNGEAILDMDDDPVFNLTESISERPCTCLHYVGPEPLAMVVAMR
jgi:hypothetical protein